MLKDAEKRGEVINIDSDEESAQGKENKRRKVSLSPQANNNNNAASTAIVQTNNNQNSTGQSNSTRINTADNRRAVNSAIGTSDVDQTIVDGCGIPQFNGIHPRKWISSERCTSVYIY